MGYGKGLKLLCDSLKDNYSIVGVFTQDNIFYERNLQYFNDLTKFYLYEDIVEFCKNNGIDFFQDTSVNSPNTINWIKSKRPDLIISYSLWVIVQSPFLYQFKNNFNIHGSNIPNLMGRAPQSWAILNGFNEIGWSIHKMELSIDQGDIVKQITIPILKDDIPLSIIKRQYECLPILFDDFLEGFAKKNLKYKKINPENGNYWPKLNTDIDGKIDWSSSSAFIDRTVRAFNKPFPGAWTELSGKKIRILETKKCKNEFISTKSGIIFRIDEVGCYVSSGDGAIIISKVFCDGEDRHAKDTFKLGDKFS